MKIALVVHDYHRAGGHSRYTVELAERFSRTNQVHVFANTFVAGAGSAIQFHHVPALRKTALTTIFSFLPGTRSIGPEFEIIHAQGLCSLRADVVTAHICNRAWFNARKRFEESLALRDYFFDAVVSPIERRLYSNPSNAVVAVSNRISKDLALYCSRGSNVDVIYHGVDSSQFTPANRQVWRSQMRSQLNLRESDFVFLFVGDLRKGAAVVIEALSLQTVSQVLFVSRTPPAPYIRLARRFGVANRVLFAPATQNIERSYAASDAFVFPTPYDAFGMVIAEAMASGLPVITSREAGAAEWISQGVEGILLDNPADARALAAHMQRVSEDPEACRALGGAARSAAEQHSWDAVAARTMQVYEAAVHGRRR
jgi:glycosyltransferase involved in cell wall biosynthesis